MALSSQAWTRDRAPAVATRFDELAASWGAERGEYRRAPLADALAGGGVGRAGPCIEVGSGTGLLIDGHQLAVFRTFDGMLHAVDNLDPVSGANVPLARHRGTKGGVATIASPIFKQVFDLTSGQCLSEPGNALAGHDIRDVDGVVHVRLRSPEDP